MSRLTALCIALLLFQPLWTAPLRIEIEHARTDAEIQWGLMQRECLQPGRGMLFHLPGAQIVHVWSFNCLINLSVAFLDENFVFVEVHDSLEAHPDMMDAERPVSSPEDMRLYPPGDPIRVFFHEKGITSNAPVKYILEMAENWFSANGVLPGDTLKISQDQKSALIVHTR